jgi:DNA-directed RNA polymerase I and III subunit RPAC2
MVWFLVGTQFIVGEDGKTAVDALEKGLDDLMALCEVVEDKFRSALEEKNSKMETD